MDGAGFVVAEGRGGGAGRGGLSDMLRPAMSGTSVGDMGEVGDVGPDSRPRSWATGEGGVSGARYDEGRVGEREGAGKVMGMEGNLLL